MVSKTCWLESVYAFDFKPTIMLTCPFVKRMSPTICRNLGREAWQLLEQLYQHLNAAVFMNHFESEPYYSMVSMFPLFINFQIKSYQSCLFTISLTQSYLIAASWSTSESVCSTDLAIETLFNKDLVPMSWVLPFSSGREQEESTSSADSLSIGVKFAWWSKPLITGNC